MQLTNGRIKLEKKLIFFIYTFMLLWKKKKCHHWINIRFNSVFCSDKKKIHDKKKKQTNNEMDIH